jgi:tRNA (cmo5U34)-methyltransferase
MSQSSVGDSISASNASWNFSGDVPRTFEDHVSKSVPLYFEGHDLILKLSDFFLSEDSLCYDIGSSTGLLSRQIAERNAARKIRVVGLDVEADMVSFAREKNAHVKNLEFHHANIVEFDLEKCDMIVSYYTLQFTKPKVRQLIIDKIYESLNWGGAFLLFEKVRGADARFQDIMTQLYNDYKIDKGYSADNIVSKARSLKGVLEPFSTQGNIDLLKRAGFVDICTVQKYVCFEGFLAIK